MTKPKIKRGFRKPQVARPKEKDVPVNYDSILEYTLHTTILKDWDFHGEKIPYEVKHNYHPDFTRTIGKTKIILEVKGRFWNYEEYSKYIWIKKHLPKGQELVFLFANPSSPMPQAKRRKDGTKRSHAEWATANGFRWFSADSMPKSWVATQEEL
jgi:hypothetical protein